MHIEALRKELPPVFTRSTAVKLLGGAISAGGLANLDSQGEGPRRTMLGRKVLYDKESFLTWLQGRITAPAKGKIGRS